uniref:ANK_REP_REGION domain-containing protein n=1 Tax=Globodera pallida TaxID=36090 RepID=A0A183CAE5_GLOPA
MPGSRNDKKADFHTAIAQSMAQLRKTSSRGASGALSAIPVPQSSHLSALSAPARHVFSSTSSMATATTALAHSISSVCRLPMLSPEPHQQLPTLEPPAGCSLLRRSNMQSRAFFHAANNGGTSGTSMPLAASGGGRVPYRSRLSATPSAWDLGDFASVRRHRVDACGGTDFAGGGGRVSSSTPNSFPPSAQLIRSLSPPPPLLITSISSSHPASSNAINGHQRQMHPFPIEASAVLRTIGTQTMAKPSKKEVAIGTDRPKSPPKRTVRERGTSPAGPPPSVAVPSASVGVNTRDLSPESKNAPPPPPPKPSGPGLAVELQRRRDLEGRRAKMDNLSAEFQYCLGHEPEHTPGEQPQFVGPSTEGEGTTTGKRRRSTIDCGVDAFCPGEEFGATHSLSTSTTDLEQGPENNNNNNDTGKTTDAVVQTTEPPAVERSEKSVGTEPKGMRTAQVQTETEPEQHKKKTEERLPEWAAPAAAQTTSAEVGAQTDESEWFQAEIGRRLAEAATERREKRKRNSVERGTETEEKEAPDQFIMITCNKCEQRSSLASDELFEKIVVPPEDNDGDDAGRHGLLLNHKHFEEDTAQHCGRQTKEVTDACGEELLTGYIVEENVRGEMTTILEELEEEGRGRGSFVKNSLNKRPKWTRRKGQQQSPEGTALMRMLGGISTNAVQSIGTRTGSHQQQHQQQQRHQSDLQQQQQHQQLSQNVSPLSSDEGLVLADGDDGEEDEEALGGQDEEALGGQDEEALEGQDEEALGGQDEEELAALEGQADPMDMDRISLETDVQTVICAEEVNTRPGSSVSFCSVDAKTTAAASRTEALRKMLTEPQRYAQAFQRDAGSNRSYRAEKGKANDLEYIIERHKSDALREAEPTTPSCPSSAGGGRKALKEAITLKKTMPHNVPAFTQQAFNVSNIPEPVPARIPRPKFAKYSPNAGHAETADEEAEAADRLTPLRSEMRALASSLWGGGGGGNSASVSPCSSASGSPRVGRAALFLRAQNNGQADEGEEDDDGSAAVGGRRAEDGEGEGSAAHSALVVMEDASSTSSEGARTYEMSEEESAEFELSAPLRDALETIDGHLARGATAAAAVTTAEGHSSAAETEWAYKYCQHEWMKLTTKKSANAELVEQFIDALETYSSRLMQKVVNMTDQNGNTALHYAVSNENFDVVSVLLDSKVCRVDEMNKAGYSALMLAALCELRNETECAIVQRLFQMGNVNAKAVKHAQTALMLAASHGRVETTSLLLNCGADVNIQDVDGSTALMCAAEHGQREIVKILLKRPNIDASLTDCDNQTALSIAVENQHRDIGVLIYAHLNFSRLESNDQSVSI